MAVCSLSKAFRRLSILRREVSTVRFSTQQIELPTTVAPVVFQNEKQLAEIAQNYVTFTSRTDSLNLDMPRNRLAIINIIDNPVLPNIQINDPVNITIEKNDIKPNKIIEIPATTNIVEKRAERLIVIRRKKMKKHKRKKFLKRMKFVIRKREQKKKLLKRRLFEAELQSIHQEAEKFDPKVYVTERIDLLNRERLPNKWRGEILPEAMIREFLKEKEDKKAHKLRLRTYRLKLD